MPFLYALLRYSVKLIATIFDINCLYFFNQVPGSVCAYASMSGVGGS